eukprot:Unigene549_Nuclearia_a/m.1719 Unigene549_Nuclearia_a/g.1719  ORF Unigene549_Nuclearia_a/g.1719 Unigene549_Nuclearia_a/m.1719 type:complete len:452 (+) Unigene549_Nuclearia_a:72-1427(+)
MNFSQPAPATGLLARWDPAGTTLAVVAGPAVTLWRGDGGEKLRTFACGDDVQQLEWSPNGQMVLCGLYKTSQVKVFQRDGEGLIAHIDESAVGCVRAMWAPTSASLLVFSDYELRVSVWFLDSSTQGILECAGRRREKGISFHGYYAAVAERRDTKDFVGIYDTRSWQLLRRFPVQTNELESIEWSPNGAFLIVTDSYLEYKVCVYGVDGRCLKSYSAYDNELGVKTARISSLGVVAVGSYDEKVRLLDYIHFDSCAEFNHPAAVSLPEVVYKETEFLPDGTARENASEFARQRPHAMQIRFEPVSTQITLPTVAPDYEKPAPRAGVGLVEFSPKGRFLVSRSDNMPTALWIWDLAQLKQVALLVTREPVRSVKWNPSRGAATDKRGDIETDAQLAFCTGTGWVFLWQLGSIECLQLPIANFAVLALQWQPTGQALLLVDKDRFCVGGAEA